MEGIEHQLNRREMFSREDIERIANIIDSNSVRKIFVVGAMGAGKSTFAAQLSEKTKIPHIELDTFGSILEKETGTRPKDIVSTVWGALAKYGDDYIVDHAELLGKDLEGLAQLIVLLNPAHEELVRSFELRKQQESKGDWSRFGPEALREFANDVANDFSSIPGEIVYENTQTGVTAKIVKKETKE